MDITLTITDDEKKVLDSWLGENGIVTWLENALANKIRQRLDASVLENTDRNPNKMSKEDKFALLKDVTLPAKEERTGTI